jgi:hypothetical protein
MRRLLWLLFCLQAVGGSSPTVDIVVEYTTNGEVKLILLNISCRTAELHVFLLGCDYAYYDYYLISPPKPSWKTEVTPFNCIECRCEDFEFERTETFYVQ